MRLTHEYSLVTSLFEVVLAEEISKLKNILRNIHVGGIPVLTARLPHALVEHYGKAAACDRRIRLRIRLNEMYV